MVADKIAGMGRSKNKWLQAVTLEVQRVCTAAARTEQAAMRAWLQWRGTLAGASANEAQAYPCSCCKRWWKVVWATGEVGGWADEATLQDRP